MEASVSLFSSVSLKLNCDIFGLQGADGTNIPEPMRTVPIHPNDTYADPADNGPIPQKDNRTEPILTFASLELGLRLSNRTKAGDEEFAFKAGVGADFGSMVASHLNERNYTNDPGKDTRGYGAALTYYHLGATGNVYPKIFGEFSIGHFLARLQLRTYETAVANGWDRNNGLEDKDTFILGRNLEWQTYAGVRVASNFSDNIQQELRLVGGVAYSKLSPNSLGKQANVRTSEVAPIIGLEYQINFNFLSL